MLYMCVGVRVRVCEADGWESLGSWITSQTPNTMSSAVICLIFTRTHVRTHTRTYIHTHTYITQTHKHTLHRHTVDESWAIWTGRMTTYKIRNKNKYQKNKILDCWKFFCGWMKRSKNNWQEAQKLRIKKKNLSWEETSCGYGCDCLST